jgi:hypothetical protein
MTVQKKSPPASHLLTLFAIYNDKIEAAMEEALDPESVAMATKIVQAQVRISVKILRFSLKFLGLFLICTVQIE